MYKPCISIIVPIHNGERTIANCLTSILNQSFDASNYEVIVVDDFSSDGTEYIVKQLQNYHHNLRYYKNPKRGVSTARNLGISFSKGKFIGFVDQDIIAEKEWISKMYEYYKKYPNLMGVSGTTINAYPNNIYPRVSQDLANNHLQTSITLPTSNCSYRKEAVISAGGFPEEVIYGNEDAELSCRIFKLGFKTLRNEAIYVEHYRTTSLKGFLKQAYFYGYTDYWCKTTHPDLFDTNNIFTYLYHSIKRLKSNLFLLDLKNDRRFAPLDLLCRSMYIAAYGIGALTSILHRVVLDKYPAHMK